ncbi:MAG: hypothetical protein Q9181_001005 [Wetmoreana brouardii]
MSAALLSGVETSLEKTLDTVSEGNSVPPSRQVLNVNIVDGHPTGEVTYARTIYRSSKEKNGKTVHVCEYPECGKVCGYSSRLNSLSNSIPRHSLGLNTARPSTQSAKEAFLESPRPIAVPNSQPGILGPPSTPSYVEVFAVNSDHGWELGDMSNLHEVGDFEQSTALRDGVEHSRYSPSTGWTWHPADTGML